MPFEITSLVKARRDQCQRAHTSQLVKPLTTLSLVAHHQFAPLSGVANWLLMEGAGVEAPGFF